MADTTPRPTGLLRQPRVRLLLGALGLYLLWQAWLFIAAPGKVSAQIDRSQPRVNVLVSLPFQPERFHVLMFQKYGRVSGTTDTAVEVRSVPVARLHAIARYYWVSRIDPLPPDD